MRLSSLKQPLNYHIWSISRATTEHLILASHCMLRERRGEKAHIHVSPRPPGAHRQARQTEKQVDKLSYSVASDEMVACVDAMATQRKETGKYIRMGGGRFALFPILGKQIQNGMGLAHWILKAENLLMELAFGKGDFR